MLKDQLQEDLKAAMKARDASTLDTIRMLVAGMKNDEIAKGGPLTAEEEVAVLRRGVKSRTDAAEVYRKGGRNELAEKELAEIAVIRKYLPAQMSEEELARAVDALIEELGITGKKDMGRLMKELMSRYEGRVDGREASRLASSRLS